jgi:hypothetical protein
LVEKKGRSPSRCQKWVIPVLWDDHNPVELFKEVPMHLFFGGMTKSMALDSRESTLCGNKNKTFVKYATGLLETIKKLQLPWLKVLPYSHHKVGGWVAENYLAPC